MAVDLPTSLLSSPPKAKGKKRKTAEDKSELLSAYNGARAALDASFEGFMEEVELLNEEQMPVLKPPAKPKPIKVRVPAALKENRKISIKDKNNNDTP
jgi:hypothetical protein